MPITGVVAVQERGYAVKDNNQQFEPTPLGEALIGAYDNMGLKTVYECASDSSIAYVPHSTCCQ